LRITDKKRGDVRGTSPRFFYGVIRILQMIRIYGGGLQITDLHGVIRILQMIRIYRVQILKCASLYFRVQNLQIYRLQINRIVDLGLRIYRYRISDGGAMKCDVMNALLAK
jgi:hypothetical protein